jgi:hypothetical protein
VEAEDLLGVIDSVRGGDEAEAAGTAHADGLPDPSRYARGEEAGDEEATEGAWHAREQSNRSAIVAVGLTEAPPRSTSRRPDRCPESWTHAGFTPDRRAVYATATARGRSR